MVSCLIFFKLHASENQNQFINKFLYLTQYICLCLKRKDDIQTKMLTENTQFNFNYEKYGKIIFILIIKYKLQKFIKNNEIKSTDFFFNEFININIKQFLDNDKFCKDKLDIDNYENFIKLFGNQDIDAFNYENFIKLFGNQDIDAFLNKNNITNINNFYLLLNELLYSYKQCYNSENIIDLNDQDNYESHIEAMKQCLIKFNLSKKY